MRSRMSVEEVSVETFTKGTSKLTHAFFFNAVLSVGV